MNVFIKQGADVNIQYDYQAALLCVAQNGHEKCVLALIDGGADVNTPVDGDTGLMHAARRGQVKSVSELV